MRLDFHSHTDDRPLPDGIRILNVDQLNRTPLHTAKHCSIGLHPWFLTKENAMEGMEWLEKNLRRPNVLTLGECGLDRLKGAPLPFQQKQFEQQLELAQTTGKPVAIHCVRAFAELVDSVNRTRPNVPLIIHGFNKKVALFRQLARSGFLFSFGAALLNETSPAAETIRHIPPDMFFLESDDAGIDIHEIYKQAIRLRGQDDFSNHITDFIQRMDWR